MKGNDDSPAGSLLFIYAADSGLFNTVADIAHKVFSPGTYKCDLCALTHGYFQVREEWQDFVAGLDVPCRFLHRDQAVDIPGIDMKMLPAIYRHNGKGWVMCMTPNGIARSKDLSQLKRHIKDCCIPD